MHAIKIQKEKNNHFMFSILTTETLVTFNPRTKK